MGNRMPNASKSWNRSSQFSFFGVYNYSCEVRKGIHGCIEDQYEGSTVCINGGLDGEE